MNIDNSNKLYFDINKKSKFVAYLLWFLLFCIGGHRFYTRNYFSAIVIVALSCFTFIFLFLSFPFSTQYGTLNYLFISLTIILSITLTIWFIVDAFLTYNNVNKYNTNLAIELGLLDKGFGPYIK